MDHCDRARRKIAMITVVAAATLPGACTDASHALQSSMQRQTDVAERGQMVMPFDLDRTTHRFRESDTGGE